MLDNSNSKDAIRKLPRTNSGFFKNNALRPTTNHPKSKVSTFIISKAFNGYCWSQKHRSKI